LLDRSLLRGLLGTWARGTVRTSPGPVPREGQVTRLLRLCQSELEQKWVRLVDRLGLKLPREAQTLIEACRVRPDFLYRQNGAAIFIDGPVHDTDAQQIKDAEQQDALENFGYTVIHFHHADDWEAILRRYPTLFGIPLESSDDYKGGHG